MGTCTNWCRHVTPLWHADSWRGRFGVAQSQCETGELTAIRCLGGLRRWLWHVAEACETKRRHQFMAFAYPKLAWDRGLGLPVRGR